MRLSQIFLALSGVAGIIAQRAPLSRRDDNPPPETAENKTTVAPKRYILEFAEVSPEIVVRRFVLINTRAPMLKLQQTK